jgi:hypothetical protein
MRRSEGVAAQEAPAITRKAGLLSDQKGPSRASNGTGKNAGLSSRMRVHFPTMEIRVEGINNKIRVIQRRAYGLRDEEYLRLKILTRMLPEI